MNKRVLIITHRPRNNYGGIAQAFALQRILKGLGAEVETTFSLGSPVRRYITSNALIRKYIIANPRIRKLVGRGPSQSDETISKFTQRFVDSKIVLIPLPLAKRKTRQGQYDLLVSGSDQVWRAKYSYIPDYMFSFAKNIDVPRISYAASFGKDDLQEFSDALRCKAKVLSEKFSAISVREKSGVKLVKDFWSQEAVQHVDPTLLLQLEEYEDLISSPSVVLDAPNKKGIFVYVLDPSVHSNTAVLNVEKHLKLESKRLIDSDLNDGKALPPFEYWLRSFRDAEFVVTDSFHGTVFSILFNKPFISIGNESRGLARFASLLEGFSLSDRLILNGEEANAQLIGSNIDWGKVNRLIDLERIRSLEYLAKFL